MLGSLSHACSIATLVVDPKVRETSAAVSRHLHEYQRQNREIDAGPLRKGMGISDGLLMEYFRKDRIESGFCDRFLYALEQ